MDFSFSGLSQVPSALTQKGPKKDRPRIDENAHSLRENESIIEGLYCAGEITGGIHGGNRLGGNAMVDFTVFGKIAGTSAATGE